MTKEEAIKSFEEDNRTMLENKTAYINELKARGMKFEDRMVSYIDEAVERNELAIPALKGNEWIPVNGIEDIPKSGSYWVTREYSFDTLVEKIRWSDAWRCWVDMDDDSVMTKESAEIITAYMPYFEPEPYKAESEDEQ